MKKILSYLGAGTIPCAIFALLFFMGQFDSCSSRRTDGVISQVEINEARRQIADSITAKYTNEMLAKIDSVERFSEKKIKRLKSEYRQLEALIVAQVDGYESDSMYNNPECESVVQRCDSILALYAEYSDTLVATIQEQDDLIAAKNERIAAMDNRYNQLNLSYSSAKLDISIIKEQLASKNTWWARNQKWIYFVGGAVGAALILK